MIGVQIWPPPIGLKIAPGACVFLRGQRDDHGGNTRQGTACLSRQEAADQREKQAAHKAQLKQNQSNEDITELKKKIALTIQKIDINNLLKDIDIEELQLLAKNNKQMNFTLENMMTKWNCIVSASQP